MPKLPKPLRAIVLALLGAACDPGGPPPAEDVVLRDPRAPAPLRQVPAQPVPYRRDYRFGEDWFSHHTPHWSVLLAPFAGRPDVHYLEVGLWEGRSFFWVLDHVLTHPTSTATGIDIVLGETLQENLARSGAAERVTLIRGASQAELRKLPARRYDVIYIDGSHTADDVLEDMVLSWRLLAPSGLMILDDYGWTGAGDWPDRFYRLWTRSPLAFDTVVRWVRDMVAAP